MTLPKTSDRTNVFIVTLLIILACVGVSCAANAQSLQCAERNEVLQSLYQRYDEAVEYRAILQDGRIVELLRAGDGSTFTQILTTPDGHTSCLIGAGEDWQAVPRSIPSRKEPV